MLEALAFLQRRKAESGGGEIVRKKIEEDRALNLWGEKDAGQWVCGVAGAVLRRRLSSGLTWGRALVGIWVTDGGLGAPGL